MKFTLTTYDCILSCNAGSMSGGALEFAQKLQDLTRQFSEYSGVAESDVCWVKVNDSDWCKNCVVLFATVPKDWQPRQGTDIINKYYDPNWFPNTAKPFWCYLQGRGKCVNILADPPENPHNLFRTEISRIDGLVS